MPEQPELPLVRETAETMVFAVRSATNPKTEHRVDLIALAGYGQCSCKSWACRASPAIKKLMPPGIHQTTCKHVRLARNHFTTKLLIAMSRMETTPPPS